MSWIGTNKREYRAPYLSFDVKVSTITNLEVTVKLVLLVRAGHEPKDTFTERSDRNLKIVRKFIMRDVAGILELDEVTMKDSVRSTHSELIINASGKRDIVARVVLHCRKWVRLCQSPCDFNWRPPALVPKPRPASVQLELGTTQWTRGSAGFLRKSDLVEAVVADDTYIDL